MWLTSKVVRFVASCCAVTLGILLVRSCDPPPAHSETEFGSARPVYVMAPPALHGQGVLTPPVGASSGVNTLGNLVLAPNSAGFPSGLLTTPITLKVQGNALGGVYVCWQGGNCTPGAGEWLTPGESQTRSLPNQSTLSGPPTVYAPAATIIDVEW